MITLKTLPEASAQAVYDQVVTHMLTQKAQSLSAANTCAYRGSNGLMCAAGCLIADDEYNPDMDDIDGKCWSSLIFDHGITDVHSTLIETLQSVHDSNDPAESGSIAVWVGDLRNVADDFNLNTQVLDTLVAA